MRPLSAVLQDLLIAAEYVIAKPLAGAHAVNRIARMRELGAELRRHDELPAEAVRATRGAVCLVVALEEYFAAQRDRNQVTEALWCATIGVLLPLVRFECSVAFTNERGAR
jgi:hypothetical protein